MTVRECIEMIDELRPNPVAPFVKVEWLAELDGTIALDVMLMDISEVQQFNYREATDMDRELLVRFPHDSIYQYFLVAKLDFVAGEMKRYNNDIQLYNNALAAYTRWFAQRYEPAMGE